MAAITICSDFGAPQNKVSHCFPFICHEVMGPDAMIFLFWMLSFKPTFSLSTFTFKLYKKGLHDPDNHDGVITDLEPDILECEVKWALESITTNKASGGDRIPVELFQILKDDAVKVLHSICQQIWKTQQWPQDWKRSVFIPVPKKGNAKVFKLLHNCSHLTR